MINQPTDTQCFRLAKASAPPLALARARALLLQKLTQHGPSVLRTFLYEHWIACPQGAWLSQLQDDVKLIALYVPSVQDFLSTHEPVHDLLESLRVDPTWWPRQTRAADKAFQKALDDWAKKRQAPASELPLPLDEPSGPIHPVPLTEPRPFACHQCHSTFVLRKHLGVHLCPCTWPFCHLPATLLSMCTVTAATDGMVQFVRYSSILSIPGAAF